MHVATSMMTIEYLLDLVPYMNNMSTAPNNIKDREKNTLIALTAIISSVALTSIYEYQFHNLGTKKCQTPNPIDRLLPTITRTLASMVMTMPLKYRLDRADGLDNQSSTDQPKQA